MSAQFSLCHIYCSGITFLASCLVFRCNVATVQPSPATWQTQDVHSVTATLICEFNASESRKNSLLRTSSSKINRPVFSLQTFWLVMVGIFAALTYNKSWFAKCPGKLWRRAGTHSTVTLKQLSVIQPPLIISIHTCAFPTVTCQNVFGTKKKKRKGQSCPNKPASESSAVTHSAAAAPCNCTQMWLVVLTSSLLSHCFSAQSPPCCHRCVSPRRLKHQIKPAAFD